MKCLFHFLFYIRSACTDLLRHKFDYCLAFTSCLIVVTVAAVVQTALDHAPLIFLRIAEGSAGEIDLSLEPQYKNTYLNYNQILNVVDSTDRLAPRVYFFDALARCTTCTEPEEVDIVFIDSEKEEDIEIGREYDLDPPPLMQVYMHEKLAKALNVKVGDSVVLIFNDQEYFDAIYEDTMGQNASLSSFNIQYTAQIADLFKTTEGKFPDSDSTATIIAEISSLMPMIKEGTKGMDIPNLEEFQKRLDTKSGAEYCTNVLGTLSDPRVDHYMSSNYDNIQQEVTTFSSKVVDELGFYPLSIELPVLEQLRPLRFVQIFLGLLLNMILFILFLLSTILIYSLLMMSIETKTYQLGVFRVLGLSKIGMVLLIWFQSFFFVFPAIIIGILISFAINEYISGMFESNIGVGFDPAPTPNAIGNAILIGILIPLISSLHPVYNVLQSQLSEAMDISHNKSKAVAIQIDRDNRTSKLALVCFGVISVGFGISIYYILPLAMLSFDIEMFVGIFFAILLALLLGLVLLSLNVQYLVERVVVFIFFIWESSAIRLLILKNLAAHRLRNRKTTIMYSLGLGFIIFISVNYQLQLQSSTFRSLRYFGVYLEVSTERWEEDSSLPVNKLESIMESYGEHIDQYSWVTQELLTATDGTQKDSDDVLLKHIGQLFEYRSRVVGVSPNLFDTVIQDFINIEEQGEYDTSLSEQLYTARGTQGALVGTYFKDRLQLDVDKDSKFIVQIYDEGNSVYRELRPLAFMNSCSGFIFSRYPGNDEQHLIVSIPTYQEMLEQYLGAQEEVPMGRLLIKLSTSDDGIIDDLYNELNDAIRFTDNASVWDYRDIKESEDESTALMSTIFSVVTGISMFLCFFSLVSSMTANMIEQSKEIGILRSIGMTRMRITMLYVYESFVLVFSASILGLLIGTTVAWTMVAQQIAFTDLPIPFYFPWPITIAIFIASIICSFGSSFVPAFRMLRKAIAEIMRLTG